MRMSLALFLQFGKVITNWAGSLSLSLALSFVFVHAWLFLFRLDSNLFRPRTLNRTDGQTFWLVGRRRPSPYFSSI